MKTLLFLLLCWDLCLGRVAAQTPSAGPWRVVRRRVRVRQSELGWLGKWSHVHWEEDAYHELQNYFGSLLPSEERVISENWLLQPEKLQAKSSPDTTNIKKDWWTIERPAPAPTLSDTATELRTQRILLNAPWDVDPDSIRLFLACENPLLAPPTSAGIRFAATGATLRLDNRQHRLWLAPSAPVVVLRAYRGQRLLFRHEFQAVAPPAPTVQGFVGSRYADDAKPDEEGLARTITYRAIPDPDFTAFMPEDARYRVARFSVTAVQQGKASETLVIDGPQGDISELKFKEEPGDQLHIEVKRVQRQNFQMKVFEVPLPRKYQFLISYPTGR